MNWKYFTIFFVALSSLGVIVSIIYLRNFTDSVSYKGLGESESQMYDVRKEIIVMDTFLNSDKIEFVQRKITGGGVNPGWVISLLETQPKIFTGRVIVDDGVYQHPVTLEEVTPNIFTGEMRSPNGKKDLFSMKKIDGDCVDEEKNIFEYSLTGVYGAKPFSGCGGEVIFEAK
jgi:hypothetical protein